MAGAYEYDEEDKTVANKKSNGLPIWGNEKSMNLNPLILTNIQSSQYFKVNLYQLKTYHEVIDEIYYHVSHLEPWEKGSRKTSGQTGMCGGVRGVGAGGIVSTAFCILYKLYTLRLSRKQVIGLLNHGDSPYIRGLGFMYIRYTQPPADLWDWLEPYLDDEEEIDVRAGGGQTTTIGQVVRHMLSKLEWYSTLFPRIPVPIMKDLEKKLGERVALKPQQTPAPGTYASQGKTERFASGSEEQAKPEKDYNSKDRDHEKEHQKNRDRDRGKEREKSYEKDRERDVDRRNDKSREKPRDYPRERNGDYERGGRERERHRERERDHDRERDRDHDRHRNRDKERRRSRSRSRDRKHRHHERHADDRGHKDFADLLEREKYRIKKEKKRDGSRDRHPHRSRSHDREKKHRY